jgi:hypothetical protein
MQSVDQRCARETQGHASSKERVTCKGHTARSGGIQDIASALVGRPTTFADRVVADKSRKGRWPTPIVLPEAHLRSV